MKKLKNLRLRHLFLFASMTYTIAVTGQMPNQIEINNGVIKLKLDLTSGGAISYLSAASNNYNVINIHDKGRYIQQSYYTGQPIDRRAQGQHPNYSPWNWNPIQAGDVYENRSQVLDYRQSSNELYVKNRPMLWDMNNSPCECYFETWVTLEGTAAHVRNKLTVFRTDNLWQTRANHQELPAVYSIGDLHKLYTYRGSAPWTKGGLSKIENIGPPWEYWNTNESWAALVNNNNWGLGVYNPISTYFVGGFSGSPGGGPSGSSTGYFSPLITKALSKNGIFQYEYDLILGNLEDIRNYVYNKRGIGNNSNNVLAWEFNQSGNTEGWKRAGGTSSVSAVGRALKVITSSPDPQIILDNISINPQKYSFLKIGMRNFTNDRAMDLFWSNNSGGFSGSKRIRASVVSNSDQQEYVFDLRNVPLWNNGGTINAIRIDPPGNGSPIGEYVTIDYIRFTDNVRSKKASNDNLDDNTQKVFPNPFTNELNIQTKESQFSLYDFNGKLMKIPNTRSEAGLNLITRDLKKGIYYLRVGKEVHIIYKQSEN